MTTLRNFDQATFLIRKREDFKSRHAVYSDAPNFWGIGRSAGTSAMVGALPRRYWDSLIHASYVIHSFHTPIAWYATRPHEAMPIEDVAHFLDTGEFGMWVVPAVKYSQRTTKHQSLVQASLSGYHYAFRYDPDAFPKITYSEGWGEYNERIPMGGY